ncbi:hypothetical protein KR100_11310 [Synechococcus sp. KORDI-100]|nr:hypothetical protein KR100_11310 [Synechococcus sp. KORDI-100]
MQFAFSELLSDMFLFCYGLSLRFGRHQPLILIVKAIRKLFDAVLLFHRLNFAMAIIDVLRGFDSFIFLEDLVVLWGMDA